MSKRTDKNQFNTWNIENRALREGLVLLKDPILLNKTLFPGYAIKNVKGRPFNIKKANTYIFVRDKSQPKY